MAFEFELEDKVPSKWRIGRRQGKKLVASFDIQRRSDGGISVSNVERLTDPERHILLAHFGSILEGLEGGQTEKGISVTIRNKLPPGSVKHFLRAIYSLPPPFEMMQPLGD